MRGDRSGPRKEAVWFLESCRGGPLGLQWIKDNRWNINSVMRWEECMIGYNNL